jgi:hypothetical protein
MPAGWVLKLPHETRQGYTPFKKYIKKVLEVDVSPSEILLDLSKFMIMKIVLLALSA